MRKIHLLCMLCALFLFSCSRNSHQEALRYYVTLQANVNAATANMEHFKKLIADPEMQADKDTLFFACRNSERELSEILDTVRCVKDIDNNTEFREKTCSYIEAALRLQQKTMPAIEELETAAGNGERDLAAQLRHTNEAGKMTALAAEINVHGQNFRNRHGIEQAEIQPYGLR